MPQYEYSCESCEVEFTEMLMTKEESERYLKSHPCPICGNDASRLMSSFAFGFKGSVRGQSGVHGNSGVHDLDYPTLDKAVGRSSEVRWKNIKKRQEYVNQVRKETGSFALTEDSSGNLRPTDSKTLEMRAKAIDAFSKSKSQNSDK